MTALHGQFLRFIAAGVVNAIVTYPLYLGLLAIVGYQAAYAIAYVVGIVLSYVVNARFVFHAPLRLADFLRFPLVYVVQYVLGAAGLWLLVDRFGMRKEWALAVVIAFTVPIVFALSRWVLVRR
jgi:putative flippase GtrA